MSGWLFIDTSDRSRVRLAHLPEDGEIIEWVSEGLRQPFLERLSAHISPEEIRELDGICVTAGPGSFSSIRSGVLVANLLSRLYSISLYGVSVEQSESLYGLRDMLRAHTIVPSEYIAPIYDAEPNITCSPLVS